MKKRTTIQSKIVLATVTELGCHATAEEIYERIAQTYPNISRGTVYRNLNKLSESGSLLKIPVPDGADHYDFRCQKHGHLQCSRCKRVFDLKQFDDAELLNHVAAPDGFEITGHHILFYGICPSCAEK